MVSILPMSSYTRTLANVRERWRTIEVLRRFLKFDPSEKSNLRTRALVSAQVRF